MKYNVVNTKNVHSTQRFDPSFHLSDASNYSAIV